MSADAADARKVRVLASVGIPAPEEFVQWVSGPVTGHYLDQFITDDVARTLWRRWNPRQSSRLDRPWFLEAFRRFVADYVALGLNVDHLEPVCGDLADPDPARSNWVTPFEQAVAGRDRCRWRLVLSPDSYAQWIESSAADRGESWNKLLQMMRDGLFYELGVVYPAPTVSRDETLEDVEFRVEWNDVELPPQPGIPKGMLLVNETAARMQLAGFDAREAVNPANGNACALVPAEHAEAVEALGLTTWTALGHIVLATSAVLRRAAGAFVNRYLVEHHLESLAQAFPALVQQIRASIGRDVLVQVLRHLLNEEISIRDLRAVLEALLLAQVPADPPDSRLLARPHPADRLVLRTPPPAAAPTVADLVEHVRVALGEYISHKYSRGSGTLNVYRVAPAIEQRLQQPVDLTWNEAATLFTAVRDEVSRLPAGTQNPVVLSAFATRQRLRSWIRWEFPHLAVLSQYEVDPGLTVRQIGTFEADLQPYPESWPRLLHAIGAGLEPAGAGAGRAWSGPVGQRLTRRRHSIIEAIEQTIAREPALAFPADVLEALIDDYFAVCATALVIGGFDDLDRLLTRLARALETPGTRCADVLRMTLAVHREIRAQLAAAAPGSGPDEAAAIAASRPVFEEIERRVIGMCVRTLIRKCGAPV